MPFDNRELAGRKVRAIGLGCMSLSQGYLPLPSEEEGERLLHHAIDIGYDLFDTARLYGRGHNEALLSRVLMTRRNELFLSSKCGIEFGDGKRWIDCRPETNRRAVDRSLSVMGVDYIDLYYLHRRDFEVPIEESVGALAALKEERKIGAIGLSEMSSDTLRRAAAEHPIAAMQGEYSLWTRNPELGVLETCRELGTAFVAFSPVGRGALANPALDPTTLRRVTSARRIHASMKYTGRRTVNWLLRYQISPPRLVPRRDSWRSIGCFRKVTISSLFPEPEKSRIWKKISQLWRWIFLRMCSTRLAH